MHELTQIQNTCLDSLLQTGAFTQEARILADIVLAVFTLHILWSVIDFGTSLRLWAYDRAETSSTAPLPAAACLA